MGIQVEQIMGYLAIEPFTDFSKKLAIEIQFAGRRGPDGVSVELTPARAKALGYALICYAEHAEHIDPLDSEECQEVEDQIRAILNAD